MFFVIVKRGTQGNDRYDCAALDRFAAPREQFPRDKTYGWLAVDFFSLNVAEKTLQPVYDQAYGSILTTGQGIGFSWVGCCLLRQVISIIAVYKAIWSEA